MPAPRSAPAGAHRGERDRIAEREAEQRRRARRAAAASASTSRASCAPLEAEHAQQRVLAAAPRHLQRLRREHQEAAGEQRHHREHVEVHAVGARRIGARLLQALERRGMHAGRQQRRDRARSRLRESRSRLQAHVDAVELAQAAEAPLRGGDVGERADALAATAATPATFSVDGLLADRPAEARRPSPGQRFGRRGRQKHAVRREQLARSSVTSCGCSSAARRMSMPVSAIVRSVPAMPASARAPGSPPPRPASCAMRG